MAIESSDLGGLARDMMPNQWKEIWYWRRHYILHGLGMDTLRAQSKGSANPYQKERQVGDSKIGTM